jgi:hypothetical protein
VEHISPLLQALSVVLKSFVKLLRQWLAAVQGTPQATLKTFTSMLAATTTEKAALFPFVTLYLYPTDLSRRSLLPQWPMQETAYHLCRHCQWRSRALSSLSGTGFLLCKAHPKPR